MAQLETPRFPKCVSLGALSKPRYKTNVIPVASGYKSKNIEWAQGLHSFDFSHNVMTQFQHDSLLDFFHAIQGMGNTFRVHDPGDYQTTISNGVLIPISVAAAAGTPGAGYGVNTYLAGKKYTAGALTTYRWLQKLVSGTSVIYRNGSPVTVGVAAGNIAINADTGYITFVADQTRSISSHTVGATHVFTLATAFSPNLVVGGRIYVSGISGTAATTLNGLSHTITNVASNVITVSAVTTGLTATGGTASFFPQSTDALTLVTDFDVPCMFSSDEANFELFEKNATEYFYRWSGINLEEDRIALT